jgi:hypothetical protein
MPQYPLSGPGQTSLMNVSAAVVAKSSAGVLSALSVITTGATTGAVYDTNTLASTVAARQIWAVPNTPGYYPIIWEFTSGLTLVPSAGQVLAISLT